MAMFGHQKEQEDPYLNMINESDSLKSRVYVLEMTDRTLETDIKKRDEQMSENREKVLKQAEEIHREIRNIWSDMRKMVIHVQKLIVEIKGKAKKEDLERITRLSDDWPLETYITKREFERVVRNAVSETQNG